MRIVTEKPMEYRVTKTVHGKNGDYYLHTFEDGESMFTFYCKESADKLGLVKGQEFNLVFECTTYNGQNNFIFSRVLNE